MLPIVPPWYALVPGLHHMVAWVSIPFFARVGWTPTRSLREFRRLGYKIRTETWWDYWEERVGARERSGPLARDWKTGRPPRHLMTPGKVRAPYKYRYVFRLPVLDVKTGKWDIDIRSVQSPEPLTLEEALEAMRWRSQAPWYKGKEEWDVAKAVPYAVIYRKPRR